MTHLKVKGFVIREVPVGEADRIINILTADLGLISVSVRGARRAKSQLLLSTQVFSLSEFELFASKGHYAVNSAELIEPFLALHQDMTRLVCASHLAEVLLDSMRDDVAQPDLYRLWAFALQALQSQADPLLLVHVAQLRLLADIGFAPCLDACVVCGRQVAGKAAFSCSSCGVVCGLPSCRLQAREVLALSDGVLNALRYCVQAPLSKLFNFKASPEVRQALILIISQYLTHQMEKSYTRLRMLEGLADMEDQVRPVE